MNLIDALKATGKARVRAWPKDHNVVFDGEYFIYSDTKAPFDFKYCHAYLISDDWEPYVDCKHEPSQLGQQGTFMATLDVCEKCGAKIKATGWELA